MKFKLLIQILLLQKFTNQAGKTANFSCWHLGLMLANPAARRPCMACITPKNCQHHVYRQALYQPVLWWLFKELFKMFKVSLYYTKLVCFKKCRHTMPHLHDCDSLCMNLLRWQTKNPRHSKSYKNGTILAIPEIPMKLWKVQRLFTTPYGRRRRG